MLLVINIMLSKINNRKIYHYIFFSKQLFLGLMIISNDFLRLRFFFTFKEIWVPCSIVQVYKLVFIYKHFSFLLSFLQMEKYFLSFTIFYPYIIFIYLQCMIVVLELTKMPIEQKP